MYLSLVHRRIFFKGKDSHIVRCNMERPKIDPLADSEKYIGCCGAYCRPCRAFTEGFCKGCKLGYETKERDISKAKCSIKVCCINKNYETCADCQDYSTCEIIQGFYSKNGYKYKKYRKATEFIRENGYAKFIEIADKWKYAHGKY